MQNKTITVYACMVKYLKNRVGRQNAVHGAQLAEAFGIMESMVRRIINEARHNGIPICSTQYGYYYSADPKDIEQTIDSLRRRTSMIDRAVDGLKECMKSMNEKENVV